MVQILDTYAPEPALRVALWEPIVVALRRAIILGELPTGLHLEEPALAEKFGVSRIPIREALARLFHEGLIRLEPRRGAFVVGMNEADVHDVYELRLLIETHAIRRAAETSNPAGLAKLQLHADLMAEAVRNSHLDRVAEPDVNFHRVIITMANNRRLLAAWEPIGGLVATILSITDTTYRDMPRSVASHQAMIDMLRAGDADAAVSEIRAHLENGEAVMREAMQSVRQGA